MKYKGHAIYEQPWVEKDNLDPKIKEEFKIEIRRPSLILSNAVKKIVKYMKYWLDQSTLENYSVKTIYWSMDGEDWKLFPSGWTISLGCIESPLSIDEKNLKDLQECIDANVEPFVALEFLHKAINEDEPRYKWIYATIAAELAIKEYLIEKDWRLEVLLNSVQSPPLNKLYGPILKQYSGLDSAMSSKDIQNAIEVRNMLLHRPKEININSKSANLYVQNVKTLIFQLITDLYPGYRLISKNYPPRLNVGNYHRIDLEKK
jgi:hypothetical protein